MNNITLTFPAEWLERIDHVVGFHLPAARGNDDSGFVVLKLKRLADMLRNVDTVLKGRPSRQELQQALAGVGAGMDIWVKAVEGLTPKLAKVSYGEGPDAYARQHLDSLAGEIRAITMYLSEQKLAPELWGERSLKVALMLLKQQLPVKREPDVAWDALQAIRSVLTEAGACIGNESPKEVEAQLRLHLTEMEANLGWGVRFDRLRADLTELGEVKESDTREDVLDAALKILRNQVKRISVLENALGLDDANALEERERAIEQNERANNLRDERDKAVELLNNMFKPALSQAVASLREREAREWLKLKGWLTET